ncbi:PD-(D/E)XK nuclease domain-containing protein, partial [Desulfocapsa sp. AH-315-G09]|nr:PD-(D/E)XK nuclease domain-containing protein [Desulfocapsa sp. AH-315-G09]
DLMEKDREVVISEMADRFGIQEMLSDNSRDNAFLASFLYYSGVLTLQGETDDLEVVLRVPNLVMKKLYIERIQPLCDFVEQKYFKVFDNRDYITANELTVKTAFLTLLYNDLIYLMDSETENDRRYADLTMIIRPDKRHGAVFDILIEFKFVSLSAVGLSGVEAKKLFVADLYQLPDMVEQLENGVKQVKEYGHQLEQKYSNLRLKKFVVVALGFDRLCFEAVG